MNWGTRIFSPLHLCPVVVSEGVHKLSPLPQCPTTSKNHPRSQTPHKIKAGPCGSCMAVQLLHKPAGSPDFPVGANPYSLPSTLPVCKYVSRSQLPGKLTRQSRAKGSWRKQGLPAHRAQTGAAWAPAAGRLARGRVGRNSQAEGGPPPSGPPGVEIIRATEPVFLAQGLYAIEQWFSSKAYLAFWGYLVVGDFLAVTAEGGHLV